MRAGLLTEVIEVWHPVTLTNAFGEPETTMEKTTSTRARVIHNSGSRSIENQEIVYPYNYTFEVYRYVDVEEDDEIRFDGKKYRILSINVDRKTNKKTIDTQVINE